MEILARTPFDGYKQYPGCDHSPRVILSTVGMVACILCALYYMAGIEGLVVGFTITDGELNDQAKAYHFTRTAPTSRLPAAASQPEGGNSSG